MHTLALNKEIIMNKKNKNIGFNEYEKKIKEINEKYIWSDFYSSPVILQQEFSAEISRFNVKNWEPGPRGARLAASSKRYKTASMLNFIMFSVACSEAKKGNELDLTPTFVKKLCNGLFDRTGSQKCIVTLFGVAGRTDKNKQNIDDTVAKLVDKYRKSADSYWESVIAHLEYVKSEHRDNVAAATVKRKKKEEQERRNKGIIK